MGNSYAVTGVGFTKAGKIAYATELALTSTSTYANARTASISAATTLYGACSLEVIAVTNAWYAVNVGGSYQAACSNNDIAINAISNANTTYCTGAK